MQFCAVIFLGYLILPSSYADEASSDYEEEPMPPFNSWIITGALDTAVPPLVESISDAAKAFYYCRDRAGYYANGIIDEKVIDDAGKEFANCANVAHTLTASVARCDLVAVCMQGLQTTTTSTTTPVPVIDD